MIILLTPYYFCLVTIYSCDVINEYLCFFYIHSSIILSMTALTNVATEAYA